eukprot:GHVL01016140.1.p1 GENE.GHVL01016140.1~~GHVL01016140.1.p1  ORF type:complete len:106 (+),score=8.86 GHVL01016140.1:335-652(+)
MLSRLGIPCPINSTRIIDDFVNRRIQWVVLETLLNVQPIDVQDIYCIDTILEIATKMKISVKSIFTECHKRTIHLPFGVHTRLHQKDVDNVLKELNITDYEGAWV